MVHLPHSFRNFKYIIKQLHCFRWRTSGYIMIFLCCRWHHDWAHVKRRDQVVQKCKGMEKQFCSSYNNLFLKELTLILQKFTNLLDDKALDICLISYLASFLHSTISHRHTKDHEFSTRTFREHNQFIEIIVTLRGYWYL